MSLPALDTITGCLLVATWASSLLYMSEVYQGLYYFRHFKKDDWKLKTLVTVALLVDTVSIVGDYSSVYLYTITHAGDLEYLSNINWPITLYSFTTGVLGALVQGFLLIRYWRFIQNSLISLVLFFGIIITLGAVFTASCMTALYPSPEDRLKMKVPIAVWLITGAVVDAGIALVLLWEFRKASGILMEAKGILNRLTAVIIQSGAAAATLAGAALISYSTVPESNLTGAFSFPLGRVYVITLLANLNIRQSGRSLSTTVVSSSPGTALTLTSWNIDDSCGIHVHHTIHPSVQVSLEDPWQPYSAGTFKHNTQSAVIGGSPEEIEMTSNYVSKKQ